MKIGICKLGINLIDVDTLADTNGRFKEMLALVSIFRTNGHDVELIDKKSVNSYFDKIYILNGEITWMSMLEISIYKRFTNELYYILTDLRLINTSISKQFNIVYTQSNIQIPFIEAKQLYNGMPELAYYCSNSLPVLEKDIEFIFGGGLRDREEDFKNYFSKEDETFMLLTKMPDRDTRVPINRYHNLLARSKYSLIINDKTYNENNFITWRYYENIANDVITFLDKKVDAGRIMPLPLNIRIALTVTDYDTLKYKMKVIEENKGLKEYFLDAQRKILTEEIKSGQFTYNKLMEV